mmetsp:Transcript_29933/g.41123  ORF Transcript_29933/g.41123 Transcript_29933/m.41123 type:complete len:135 (+) Transcript_29933:51-455(+)
MMLIEEELKNGQSVKVNDRLSYSALSHEIISFDDVTLNSLFTNFDDDTSTQTQEDVELLHLKKRRLQYPIEAKKFSPSPDLYVVSINSALDNQFFTVAIPEKDAVQNPIVLKRTRENQPCLLIPLAPSFRFNKR